MRDYIITISGAFLFHIFVMINVKFLKEVVTKKVTKKV